MQYITLLLFIIINLFSCQQKKENKKEKDMIDIQLVKKHLKLQEYYELPEDDTNINHVYKLTDIDVEIAAQAINKGLKDNGYQTPTAEAFNQKIKTIFNIGANDHCNNIIEHKDFFTYLISQSKEDEKYLKETEYDYTFDHIFFIKNYKLITYVPLLADFVEVINENELKININQKIIARNRYLFNDSKADLIWLLINDKEFLKQLLLVFGYDRELQINKMVLEEYFEKYAQAIPTQTERIGDLFFVKDCRGKLQIREGLLKYVEENTNANDNRFIYALGSYMNYLYDKDVDKIFEEDHSKKFSEVEKAKIVAFIASIENLAIEKYKGDNPEVWSNAASNLYNLSVSHPEVIDIIKKNNYFNLPNMKNIIEKIEQEQKAASTIQDP